MLAASVGEVGNAGIWLGSLCSGRGLNSRTRWDGLTQQLGWQLTDPFEIESVEELEGEDELLKLDLAVHPFEDTRSACNGQIRILVRKIRSLYGYVTVVPKVEAVDGLVTVPFLLRHVLDQHTDAGRDTYSLLKVSMI